MFIDHSISKPISVPTIRQWTPGDIVEVLLELKKRRVDSNPDSMRLGMEVLAVLLADKKMSRKCLEHVQLDKELNQLTELQEVLIKFMDCQKFCPGQSFQSMAQEYRSGRFNLTFLFFVCSIRQFFFEEMDANSFSMQYLSKEAEDVRFLMKETASIDVESSYAYKMENMQMAEKYFFKENCDFTSLECYLYTFLLFKFFKGDTFFKIAFLPIPKIDFLLQLVKQINTKNSPSIAVIYQALNFVHTNNSEKVLNKIRLLNLRSQDQLDIQETDKLTVEEMLDLQSLKKILKYLPSDIAEISQFQSYPNECEPITVCVQNQLSELQESYAKAKTTMRKIILFFTKLFHETFMPYGHTFFVQYCSHDIHYTAHGKKCQDRTYSREYFLPSKHIEINRINTAMLIPENLPIEKKGEFSKRFNVRLSTMINEERMFPSIGWRIYEFIIPSFTASRPEDIKLTDNRYRRMSCAQYIAEAMIEAHVETCKEFHVAPPETLEFYGFKKTQNIERLRPDQLIIAMRSKGIFERQIKKYQCGRSQPA